MKLFTLIALLFVGGFVMANSSDFSYDANQVSNSLEKLDLLEEMHKANPSESFESLTSNEAFEGVSISKATISSFANGSDLPLLPAFWWGCILGALGILIVYLITQDTEQTKSALWGCLVLGGVYLLFWLILLATGASFWFIG